MLENQEACHLPLGVHVGHSTSRDGEAGNPGEGSRRLLWVRVTEVTVLRQGPESFSTFPEFPTLSRSPAIYDGLPGHIHRDSAFKGNVKVQPAPINPMEGGDTHDLLAQRFSLAVTAPQETQLGSRRAWSSFLQHFMLARGVSQCAPARQ